MNSSSITRGSLIRSAILLVASLPCAAALAASPEIPTKVVSYADLNLTAKAGIASLYTRIERAAAYVCHLPQGTKQLRLLSEIKECRADAIQRAVAQVNLPALNDWHFARTGQNVESQQFAERR